MANFLKEFLVNPARTAAICPSSPYLAKAMTNKKTLSASQCVVELGPGTGAITEKIIDKIPQNCTFFALEINPTFVKIIESKYPGAVVYSDSAVNIQKYLVKHQVQYCDTIISSLPWAFFDQQTQNEIFDSVYNSLSAEGKMITYSYLHDLFLPSGKRFRKLLDRHFPKVKKKVVWKNFPPALVYECKK